MISRYETPAMTEIWSDQRRLDTWVQVELAVLSAQVETGVLPDSAWKQAIALPVPTPEQVTERELVTRHDVVAFLDVWGAEFAHLGMTSSDLVETAQSIALVESTGVLMIALVDLSVTCHQHALEHWSTHRVGRTHGQSGTIDTWGHRMADFTVALDRQLMRLARAGQDIAVAKLSGPTGTYADISREVEMRAAYELLLTPADVASQILMRDRLIHWAHVVSETVGICEALATEIRLMAHGDVAEARESFGDEQKGSSSMPHKRNPVNAERICGMARLARAYSAALEPSIVQWHERDIAHSSVERVALADLCQVSHFALAETNRLISGLRLNPYRMLEKVVGDSNLSSHRVLAALMRAGVPRAAAHDYVQKATREAWRTSLRREIAQTVSQAFPDAVLDLEEVFSLTGATAGMDWIRDALESNGGLA
jgi:adenylosuccinate lyase